MIKISARVVLLALLFTAAAVCHRAAAAEEDGVEIFLKAIDPEGPAAIKTGNIFYQRCVDYGPMTEEDIQAICQKVITRQKEEIARHNEEYPEDIVEDPDEETLSTITMEDLTDEFDMALEEELKARQARELEIIEALEDIKEANAEAAKAEKKKKKTPKPPVIRR